MSDLSKVKEINVVYDMAYANKHLANGWVLIAVNSVSGSDGGGKSSVSTEYVLGWEEALPSKSVSQDKDEVVTSKYALQYEDDDGIELESAKPKPKPKPITIID